MLKWGYGSCWNGNDQSRVDASICGLGKGQKEAWQLMFKGSVNGSEAFLPI